MSSRSSSSESASESGKDSPNFKRMKSTVKPVPKTVCSRLVQNYENSESGETGSDNDQSDDVSKGNSQKSTNDRVRSISPIRAPRKSYSRSPDRERHKSPKRSPLRRRSRSPKDRLRSPVRQSSNSPIIPPVRSRSQSITDYQRGGGARERSPNRRRRERSRSANRKDRRRERSPERGQDDRRIRRERTSYDRELDSYRRDRERVARRNRERGTKRNYSISPIRDSGAANTNDKENEPTTPPLKKKVGDDMITTRTGGAYIPPARLRMMQKEMGDKTTVAYQRMSWEALKKSINGHINKINVSNIGVIIREILKENIVRGRGLLTRTLMQAQASSPTFTHVYAAVAAIINTKFPQIGELLLRRLVLQFRRGFKRNDKVVCVTATRFLAHLVNQNMAHEVIVLELLTLLLENATDDSVEVAVALLKESGAKLTEVSPRGVHAIFERLRSVLHEGNLDKRTQYMIEVMFAIRKDQFKDFPVVLGDLDLVEEADQFTHVLSLDDAVNAEEILNVFQQDPEFESNEATYDQLRKEILGEKESGDEADSDDSAPGDGEESEEGEDGEAGADSQTIIDQTETTMIIFRRTVYLTIQSSLDFEECAHKLLKMEIKPGQETELCHMIIDCCAQQRTYEKFYGLLAQRFCQLSKAYVEPFEQIFRDSYDTIHRLETNKLRNVAKLFSHLLYSDAINWTALGHIKLNEEDTTSSSRIFIKILFQELSEYMGLQKLNQRVKDSTLQSAFDGLFPRDNPQNTRFAINFFTSIGLGGLTDDLREHLKTAPKPQPQPTSSTNLTAALAKAMLEAGSSSSDDSSSSDSDSSDSSDDSSSESSEDSDTEESESEDEPRQKKTSKKVSKSPKHKVDSRGDTRTKRDRRAPSDDEDVQRRRSRADVDARNHNRKDSDKKRKTRDSSAEDVEPPRRHRRDSGEKENYFERRKELSNTRDPEPKRRRNDSGGSEKRKDREEPRRRRDGSEVKDTYKRREPERRRRESSEVVERKGVSPKRGEKNRDGRDRRTPERTDRRGYERNRMRRGGSS